MAVATVASLVGAIPTMLSAPEDRALAIGLPAIALALGYLLGRVDDRGRAYTVDVVTAGLLACPGLAAHGWLRLRALDATAWYPAEQQILGMLEQAGGGGATAGILWGAAVALASLRGRRSIPLVAALVAAGAWIGAGSLAVALLIDQLYVVPAAWLLACTAVAVEPVAGALVGGTLVAVAARGRGSVREKLGSMLVGAALTAACTVPVGLLTDTLGAAPSAEAIPAAPIGPRNVALAYAPEGPPSAVDFAELLESTGRSGSPRAWARRTYSKLPWHRGLRVGVVLALPQDTPVADLLDLTAVAHSRNTDRVGLAARAEGVPSGILDNLLGHPTADLLLDAPPADATWGTVHADGSVTWDDAAPRSTPSPHCALRAAGDTTVGTLTTVVFQVADRTVEVRCNGVGFPPARCHPGGAGDPLCPPSP